MGAQKKPFFTGENILSRRDGEVNNFFLYFSGLFLYNGAKDKGKGSLNEDYGN